MPRRCEQRERGMRQARAEASQHGEAAHRMPVPASEAVIGDVQLPAKSFSTSAVSVGALAAVRSKAR